MGMTIDEAIEIIDDYDYSVRLKGKIKEALLLATDIMFKYQKIKQIYLDGIYDCECYNSYYAISEVLENEENND